jgi:transcription-repair coupling factor (superfamily II helicase)
MREKLPFDLPAGAGANGRFDVAGVPDGHDAQLVAGIARTRTLNGVLHVARDDLRMARMVEALRFIAPDLEVLPFPAWDCLPYDRSSPHRDILAARIETLSALAAAGAAGRPLPIVVTTVSALLQKVPGAAAFRQAGLDLAKGKSLSQEELTAYLLGNGYLRNATVSESGEFALRGGIVDLFPPGTQQPLRVDFFGDEIEDIRLFDPLTQRSQEKLERFEIKPVNEVTLTPAAIEAFRTGYRQTFGASGADDPLYEAISAGRHYPGMEHWLPLFGTSLVGLDSYLPQCVITLDHQADEAKRARLDTIADFFAARRDLQRADKESGAAAYKPLPPDQLYLTDADWKNLARRHTIFAFHHFGTGSETNLRAMGAPGLSFAEARTNPDINIYDAAAKAIRAEQQSGKRVLLTAVSHGAVERIGHLLNEHGLAKQVAVGSLAEFMAWPRDTLGRAVLGLEQGYRADDLLIVTEQDILGDRLTRTVARKRKTETFLAELANFAAGDFIVHVDHGVGRYEGLETLDVGGAPHDCLRLTYAGNDKLYVPVENIEVLTRYGGEDALVELDRLGGAAWQARKARVKQRIKDIANHLLKVAAQRAIRESDPLQAPAGLFDEFCARFAYAETEDQQRAIDDVLTDLAAGKPMDRLVCGDVGFGKTEVALRAAFVAAMSGKQVAVVTPTTLLCRQHFKTFSERFRGFPVKVRQLSRLVGAKETKETKEALKEGKVDIVIGTHALLSKSIEFADLGLLIVDEEQHFGVGQKERLKELRGDIHVLTLTATPIPRTLQLALTGIREMSLITTPPVDRLAVRTFVLPFDPVIIREAILREQFRGGQIFYVCPRIEDLESVAERIRKLVPEVKIVTAHGQMSATALEKAMTAFYDRSYDMLLATNIIESGLDIPTANTMIIHRADILGLAQLYQLRGRIGRSKLRGYCYLTTVPNKNLTETAQKRLEVMQTLDQLGAGFTLASHDLDIRGAGNLLGEEQSGQVREVGVELYQQLLEEAVAEARGDLRAQQKQEWAPQINLGTSVLIPEEYVTDLSVRLGLYRRIATLENDQEAEAFAAEMIDRFGPLPNEVENLLKIVAVKRLCRAAGIERIEAGPKGAVLSFRNNRFAKPDRLIDFISKRSDIMSVRPDQKLVYRQDWQGADARVSGVRKLMDKLADMAA